ncbi:hypothetical protein KM043_013155 [Ampulex compressa]|nr:hypothetical protein KM043_013155 [Ampulex compressa]
MGASRRFTIPLVTCIQLRALQGAQAVVHTGTGNQLPGGPRCSRVCIPELIIHTGHRRRPALRLCRCCHSQDDTSDSAALSAPRETGSRYPPQPPCWEGNGNFKGSCGRYKLVLGLDSIRRADDRGVYVVLRLEESGRNMQIVLCIVGL